ncbi:MAG: DUF4352 domain-containing protein [Bryobacterales bacterium]|nr:DUF4352 domain-containing protein [Bryobacterales bacterium]
MKQKSPVIQPRRRFLALAGATFLGVSCSGRKAGAGGMTFRMGERATVGKLIYNVTEAQWKTNLGDGPSARVPEHRFLIVRITVTNSGTDQVGMPLLKVFDANGKEHLELDNGEGVEGWMGFLRMLNGVETREGALLFDVVPASYKLQVTDGGDAENEQVAYVDIPLQLDADPVLAEPPAIPSGPATKQ